MLDHLQKKLSNMNFLKKSSSRDVFKNMAILASGAVLARLIGFGSTPVLTRIYTPEDFGLLALFMAVLAMLTPFSTLRYSIAIPLLKNDGIAINLVLGSIIILLLVTLLSIVVLGLFSPIIFDIFSLSTILPYWWLLPVALFGTGLYEILKSWSIRQKDFKSLAKTDVYVTASGALIKIGLGLLGLKPLGLLIGSVFTSIVGATPLAVKTYQNIKINMKHIRKQRMKFLLKRYVEYPKYRLPSQFILVISAQSPLFVLAALFSADVVGQFSLALMALSIPLSLLGNTTGQAYYAEIAKIGRKDPEKILEISKDVLKKLFLFSLIPFVIILFAAPWLFATVFGEVWYEAGEYARLLSVYMLTAFISAPLVNALSVFENQLLFLRLNLIRLGLLVGVFLFTWMIHLGPTGMILLYSIVMSIHFSYVSYIVFKVIKNEIKESV